MRMQLKMNPLKLTLLTLGCALVLATTPFAARKLFPPRTVSGSPGAATIGPQSVSVAAEPVSEFLSAGKPSASSRAISAVVAKASERAPSVRASLPAPLSLDVPSVKDHAPAPAQASIAPLPAATPKPVIPYRAEVSRAQEMLRKIGVEGCTVDGKLGPRTVAAVRDFQKGAGLVVSGEIDAATLAALDKKVAQIPPPAPKADAGIRIELASLDTKAPEPAPAEPVVDAGPVPTLMSVADVTRIQEKLAAAGVYAGPVDGKWGKLSTDATKAFQEKKSLVPTGKPDQVTWGALVADAAKPAARPAADSDAAPAALPVSRLKSVSAAAPARKPEARIELISAAKPSLIRNAVLESSPVPELSDGAAELEVSKPAPEAEETAAPARAEAAKPPAGKVAAPEAPAKADAAADEVVVKLNNVDAGAPVAETIATPAAVSSEAKQRSGAAEADAAAEAADKPVSDAKGGQPAVNPALEKELSHAQARIAIAMNDSHYELGKYAPEAAGSVNDMAGKVRDDVRANTRPTPEVRAEIVKLESGLEEAKKEALRKKAEDKVAAVESAYTTLTGRFKDIVGKDPFKGTAEKIEAGYKAMKVDFKKGNYDPIVERCDGFKLAIDILMKDVADKYVAEKLGRKSVKSKLDKSTLKEIEKLRKEEKFIEAADVLDKKSTKDRNRDKN